MREGRRRERVMKRQSGTLRDGVAWVQGPPGGRWRMVG